MNVLDYLGNAHGYDVLSAIADMQPATIADIRTVVDASWRCVKGRISQLVEMGLASRDTTGPVMTLSLTELGETVVGHLRQIPRSSYLGYDCTDVLRKGKSARMLAVMAASTPCNMSTLIRIAGGQPKYESERIHLFERMGLVTITPGRYRAKIVELTADGCSVWSHIRDAMTAVDPGAFDPVDSASVPIGRPYGDRVIPDMPDYCRCEFARRTATSDPIVCVSVYIDDVDSDGLRPVYEVAHPATNGLFRICHDYDPNTGLWRSSDEDVSAKTLAKHMDGDGTHPLNGFEFPEVD